MSQSKPEGIPVWAWIFVSITVASIGGYTTIVANRRPDYSNTMPNPGLVTSVATPQSSPNTSIQVNPLDKIILNSGEKEVDYKNLKVDLANHYWKGANYETTEILLKAFGPKSYETGEVDIQEAQKPPCDVIKTIDMLWSIASNSKFGFTAQRQVLKLAGNNYHQAYSEMEWQRLDGKWLIEEQPYNHHRHYLKESAYNNLVKGKLPTFERGYNSKYSFDKTLTFCRINP